MLLKRYSATILIAYDQHALSIFSNMIKFSEHQQNMTKQKGKRNVKF